MIMYVQCACAMQVNMLVSMRTSPPVVITAKQSSFSSSRTSLAIVGWCILEMESLTWRPVPLL